MDHLLEVKNLKVTFDTMSGLVKAVDGVSFGIGRGEVVGIVGESGSGKTTLGMCLLRLQSCDGGIRFQGRDIQQLTERDLRPIRRHMQVVFQDPYGSLSPRMSVEEIIAEGLTVHGTAPGKDARQMVAEISRLGDNQIRNIGLVIMVIGVALFLRMVQTIFRPERAVGRARSAAPRRRWSPSWGGTGRFARRTGTNPEPDPGRDGRL